MHNLTNVRKQEVTTGEEIGSGDPRAKAGCTAAMETKVWSIPIPSIM